MISQLFLPWHRILKPRIAEKWHLTYSESAHKNSRLLQLVEAAWRSNCCEIPSAKCSVTRQLMYKNSLLSPLIGRQSNRMNSIRKKRNQKAFNRQRSHLKDSPSCLAECSASGRRLQEAVQYSAQQRKTYDTPAVLSQLVSGPRSIHSSRIRGP